MCVLIHRNRSEKTHPTKFVYKLWLVLGSKNFLVKGDFHTLSICFYII